MEKLKDISNWDYLIDDNPNIVIFFRSSLLINKNRILKTGYPRVKYLIDNKNNAICKKEIKERYNIPVNKKIVMYMSTWRDYNYEVHKYDYRYQLDLEKLQNKLGNQYCVVYKEHQFLANV